MKNDQSEQEKWFQSIFCKISNKPKGNNYPDNLCFKKTSLESLITISYPVAHDLSKTISYPEREKINNALCYCNNTSEDKENPYLLVSGDLSGIQATVYSISSKGALKSLRARSFMLELLC
jgi:hypothetical protein